MSITRGKINLESVTRAQNSRLFDLTGGADDVGLVIPFMFGDGELFADFDLSVVDGEAEDVDLKALGGEFETFCFGFLSFASRWGGGVGHLLLLIAEGSCE